MSGETGTPQRLVCFGDSITAGKREPEHKRWTALLQQELEQIAPSRWEVYNRGVPGETCRDGLARFEKDIAPMLPATVLIEFGINDCSVLEGRQIPRVGLADFEAVIHELVRLVRAEGGVPVLLTSHPVRPAISDPDGQFSQRLEGYQNTIRCVAAYGTSPLIDIERGFAACVKGEHLNEDGVHLSRAGHARYASVVLEGLRAVVSIGIP